ncbi:MAG: hypothetical protein C6W57_02965 [Caldibacillus debilis]|nr:MAG: hypothetical protein C6W57_02965 [Caldibacillus debilis]
MTHPRSFLSFLNGGTQANPARSRFIKIFMESVGAFRFRPGPYIPQKTYKICICPCMGPRIGYIGNPLFFPFASLFSAEKLKQLLPEISDHP